jgi:hypothetical protein
MPVASRGNGNAVVKRLLPAVADLPDGVPANLMSWGRCRWGSWLHQLESLGVFRNDRRWSSSLVTDDSTGLRAAMTVHSAADVQAVRFPGLDVTSSEGTTGCCVLGGPARLLGGAAVQTGGSPRDAGHALSALLGLARDRLAPTPPRVAAVGVPEPQVAYFVHALDSVALHHGGVRSWLDCSGADQAGDVLRRLGSRERSTWAQDEKRRAAAGVTSSVHDESSLDQLPWHRVAELVTAVQANNGEIGSPRLTALRLTRWRRAGPCLAFASFAGDTLTGITLARVDGDALVLNDLGMIDEVEDRHALYTELVFKGPLEYATRKRLKRIELGVGHDLVKRSRGAEQSSQWNIIGRWKN